MSAMLPSLCHHSRRVVSAMAMGAFMLAGIAHHGAALAQAPVSDATTQKARAAPPLGDAMHHPNGGCCGMVAAQEEHAARIGTMILEQGGNAVDAAVATGFALAVTHPAAGNIGGGGFMLVRLQETGETVAIDYRETAPSAAYRDMYLGADGKIDEDLIYYSHAASGVPGTVAGLIHAHERFGVLPFKAIIQPAIDLAEKGYPLSYFEAASLEAYREELQRNDAATRMFFGPDGAGHPPGTKVRFPDLARTLKEIRQKGRDGFYKGRVARALADDMAANGGLITLDDLASYEVVEREPVRGRYRGYDIVSFPLPSSGGPLLIQMLNMLELRPPMTKPGINADDAHYLAEVMRLAYADRSALSGDPAFGSAPPEWLTNKDYAKSRAALIDPDTAMISADMPVADGGQPKSRHTTHFAVIDGAGNMVSNTYTLNFSYGSGVVIPGTGILMNNEMDDFAAAPGMPNDYGLVMSEGNAIEPGKRPLSSMAPTIVLKDGAPFLAIGAQGGGRIITAVLQAIINVIDRDMNLAEAIAAPRLHHQWMPDHILFEPGLGALDRAALEAKGHALEPFDWHASLHGVQYKDGWFYGFSDGRVPGGSACAVNGGC